MAFKKAGPNCTQAKAFKKLDVHGYLLLRTITLEYCHHPQYNPIVFALLGLYILPKTRELSNLNKWIGIVQGDLAVKLISSIIATRFTKQIAIFSMDEQFVPLFGKECADATFTFKSTLKNYRSIKTNNKKHF